MSKNEYRRAFIMLRPVQAGCSGHVRLERRVMTGSMYFIVTAQGEGFRAALAGQRGGEYYAAPLGNLKRDSRGQLTLAYSFDPRGIDGRPLEAYQWIAVTRGEGAACALALTGNVDGAYPMDLSAVSDAVCALARGADPAADLPSAAEAAAEAVPVNADPFEQALGEFREDPEPQPEPEPTPQPEPTPEPCPEPCPEPEPEPVRTKIYTRMRLCAEKGKQRRPSAATPCDGPLEDGYTYIHLPLPEALGRDYCLLGVRAQGDRVTSVRCALPGDWAEEPPEGLAGAVWLGAGGAGYWVCTVPCEQ